MWSKLRDWGSQTQSALIHSNSEEEMQSDVDAILKRFPWSLSRRMLYQIVWVCDLTIVIGDFSPGGVLYFYVNDDLKYYDLPLTFNFDSKCCSLSIRILPEIYRRFIILWHCHMTWTVRWMTERPFCLNAFKRKFSLKVFLNYQILSVWSYYHIVVSDFSPGGVLNF